MYIVYEGIDGSVALATLADDNVDINEVVDKFRAAHPKGFYPKFTVHNNVDVPDSRLFRDAWIKKGDKVVVDHRKAREIHLNRIRVERDRKLEELDKVMLRNLSDKDKLDEIEKEKQVLRDIPQNFKDFDVNNPLNSWPRELKAP